FERFEREPRRRPLVLSSISISYQSRSHSYSRPIPMKKALPIAALVVSGLFHNGPARADQHVQDLAQQDLAPELRGSAQTLRTWNNLALAAVRKASSIDAAA